MSDIRHTDQFRDLDLQDMFYELGELRNRIELLELSDNIIPANIENLVEELQQRADSIERDLNLVGDHIEMLTERLERLVQGFDREGRKKVVIIPCSGTGPPAW